MIYCMEFLEQNMDWLLDQLKEATKDGGMIS